MRRLEGRVAVVTGAAQGIGKAVAAAYAQEGAKVALVDMRSDIEDVAGSIDPESCRGYICDVTSRANVAAVSAEISEQLGPIGVLVNNAGVTRPAMMWKMTDEEWDLVLDTHLKGSWYWMQAVIPGMREMGWGRFINTISSAGINGTIGQANYAAAKAGLLALSRSAARELADFGILSNAVAPAAATPMTETIRTDERFKDKYLDKMILHRWAEPEEIAPTYVFLASEESSYMTGQVMSVDGGGTLVR